MKKLLIAMLITLFMAGAVFAGDYSIYTSKTTSASITAKPGLCYGFIITSATTGYGNITLFDNASTAGGSKIFPTYYFNPSQWSPIHKEVIFPVPVKFFNGIYVKLSSTIEYDVYYRND